MLGNLKTVLPVLGVALAACFLGVVITVLALNMMDQDQTPKLPLVSTSVFEETQGVTNLMWEDIDERLRSSPGLFGPRTADGRIGTIPTEAEIIGGCVALREVDWNWWAISDTIPLEHRITAASLLVVAAGDWLRAYCDQLQHGSGYPDVP